jgi:putative peptidoglycan lipid II flippase
VSPDEPKPKPPSSALDAARADAPGVDAPAIEDPLTQTVVPTAEVSGRGRGMIRSSLVFSSLTLVSRFMGFFRDLAVSYTMGASAGPAADAYNTALAFPNLFRRLFAEGAFAAAFVPAYSRKLAADGGPAADKLASDALATLAAFTVALTIVFQLTMPWLMYVINPGFASDPVKFNLAVILTQIAMPYLPCMAIAAQLSGVLNARGRFIVSALHPTLLNLCMLIAVLPQKDPQAAAMAASWGVLVAGVTQAGLVWWGARKAGANIVLAMPKLTPEIKALIGLAIPGAIAASATQINIFISGVLASQVNGARSWLAAADRLYQLPLGLVGVAIGVALLPRLSMAVQNDDKGDARSAMDEAIGFSMALTLPAACALIAMPFFLIDALFTRGEFLRVDAIATAQALFHYGWGTPAFVLTRVLAPAFFARSDTKGPMRFALASVAVNIILGIGLFHLVGFQGIAAATAIAAWLNVVLMFVSLKRRGLYHPGRRAMTRLAKILAASVGMGVLLALGSTARPLYEPFLLGSKELALLLVVGLGTLAYGAMLLGFRAVTPSEIKRALRRQPKAAGAEPPPEPDLP